MTLVCATPHGIARVYGADVDAVLWHVDVRCLAPGLFAGTQGQGVFSSSDGGRTWTPAGLDGRIVKALAVDGGTVWAATKPPALFRSDDRGATWHELPAFARMRRPWWRQPAEKPHTPYVSTLAARGDVVVAGIEGFRLLRSADGGATWQRIGRGVPFDAHELAWDGGRLLLAAGFGAAISDDRGATWRKVMDGLDRRYCSAAAPGFVAAAPMRTAHTANARACVYRLADGRWHPAAGDLRQLPYALAVAGDEVWCGLGDGRILHSANRGGAWSWLPVQLPGLRRMIVL